MGNTKVALLAGDLRLREIIEDAPLVARREPSCVFPPCFVSCIPSIATRTQAFDFCSASCEETDVRG